MAEEPEKTISIGVVGAGIGGLAAALSLLRAGFDIHVFEQARALREVGAGIQVSPNASRILHRLGLADELAAMGVRPDAFHQRRWDDGRTLLRTPLGDTVVEAFSFPHYQMHRADLLTALIRKLPAHRIHLGHRLMRFVDRGRRVQATFENGVEIEVDLLVGADGIHSIVRSIMLGAATPHFTGCVAYRGLVPADRLKHLDLEVTAEIWMGPGAHFVHYFVQNRRLVNFVAVTEQDQWTRESWTDRGDIADALAKFGGWHPQVHEILRAVDETFVWALFDRAPLERWSTGRVTLLGDSCHPMLPFMAQGAAQALEDGATLTACLIREADVPTALRLYEHVRLPRASRMQAMSATNKTRFHLPDGPEQEERDAVMASGSTDFSIKAVAWIYRHDAGRLEPAV
jgi:2-polyprenyl-6-methoxyphenol hydroxylase-like FAD-dependent oxidoreductase